MTDRVLVSGDSHLRIPYTVVDELPSGYRELFPHVEQRADGPYLVMPGSGERKVTIDEHGDVGIGAGENTTPKSRPEDRLVDLEIDGVVAELLFPDVATQSPITGHDDAVVAYCRACNDWMADAYKAHLDRFAPAACLPYVSVQAAVAELERIASLGLRPALLPDYMPGGPTYNLPVWEPLWEAAAGLGVPIAFHLWTDHYRPRYGEPGATATANCMTKTVMLETLGDIVNSGALARHPQLRVVLGESSAGWLAWSMQCFDEAWRKGRERANALPGSAPVVLDEAPSEYIKRQVVVTFQDDRVGVHNVALTGSRCLMWGSDYPHTSGGTWPNSRAVVDRMFEGVGADDVDRMVRANATELLGFTLPN